MARYRLDIEYDGAPFRGWARQPGGVETVQGHVERALEIALRRRVELTVAGRTDAGVHAAGQVASFEFDGPMPEAVIGSLNGLTPSAISIIDLREVAPDFDARRDALARSYCYRVLARRPDSPFSTGRAWWVSRPLDLARLDACAGLLVGEHDFTAFTPTDTYHRRFRRIIQAASWEEERGGAGSPSTLAFHVTGDTFMRNMVRILVGTMVEVGAGTRSVESFAALLEGAERSDAGITAPPHGLYLVGVRYPETT